MTAAAAFALFAALMGCEKEEGRFVPFQPDPGGGGVDTTLFKGFLADGRQGGALDVIIDSGSLAPRLRSGAPHVPGPTVSAFAVLKWPTGDIVLNGVYDFTVDTLYLSGAGHVLRGSFSGTGNVGIISGSASVPSGPAGFVAAHDSAASYRPWIGSFHSGAGPDSGTFCFVRADTVLAGQAMNAGAGAAMFFDGQVSKAGAPKALFFDHAVATMFDVSGSGSLNESAGTASGAYDFAVTSLTYGPSTSGTWVATRR